MTATTLTIFSLLILIFMLVGGIIGYMIHTHQSNKLSAYMHPEMYDQHGNLIPDEIVAFRFENNYDYETEDSEEDD